MANQKKKDGLTPKQKVFTEEYLKDLNAGKAAQRAGYGEKNADKAGYKNLNNPNVANVIQENMDDRSLRTQITADKVLVELYKIATCDLRLAFDVNGSLKPIHEIPEEVAKAISGIEVDELWDGFGQERTRIGETKKIKFWDKNKALEALGRHLKLFNDKLEIEHKGLKGLSESELDAQIELKLKALGKS